VSELAFLSLDAASDDALARSPMERRLREARADFAVRDGWLVAVRVPGEDRHSPAVRDVTHVLSRHDLGTVPGTVPPAAGLAALDVEGAGATMLLRRLTELDLETLPAVGALAHVRAWILPRGEESYRLIFEQEYGHYLWEVVVDAAEPLGGGPVGTP
jgi:sarcosine oxidase gamma subunit